LVNGIFLVSFLSEVSMPHYILGIDGGGTSCRAAVAGADGRILGRGKSGAANILTDPDNALIHIVGAATAAFEEANIAPPKSPRLAPWSALPAAMSAMRCTM
jgi:N-acetylglucosamine kinase-like BadF-type ATPase